MTEVLVVSGIGLLTAIAFIYTVYWWTYRTANGEHLEL